MTRLEKTSFEESFVGWDLDAGAEEGRTPYFVRATVTNRGETDLGGEPVPLYVVDGTDTLVEATTFAEHVQAVPEPASLPKPLPDRRRPTKVCLVYLVARQGRR